MAHLWTTLAFLCVACGGSAEQAEPPAPAHDSGANDAPSDQVFTHDSGPEAALDDADNDTSCPTGPVDDGTACSGPDRTCGTCADPCSFCNLLRCENGVWGRVEAFPDPSCSEDAGGGDASGNACGSEVCDVAEYCYMTGCGVDGCTPPPPECRPKPPGCSDCDCMKPDPWCMCTEVDGGFVVDCPAA